MIKHLSISMRVFLFIWMTDFLSQACSLFLFIFLLMLFFFFYFLFKFDLVFVFQSKIEVEKENTNVGAGAEASEEEWQKTLASLKEQALKMQSVSQEVYEIYSERAKVILIETSKQLKAQADKASQDLNELAKVIGEDGKEYLSLAAENSPVPLKDVVETFTSPSDDLDKISKVRDFYLGIPYGMCNV